jgi:mRNA interferase RelE/StbE
VTYSVEIVKSAQKEFIGLPADIQKRLAKSLIAFEKTPFPSGCKKLKCHDGFRVRVGDYRVLYIVFPESKKIVITAIAHRKDAYR